MSKSLLTVFSAWVIIHGRKYSYNLKLAQIYENVSSKFCKFLASFLTQECKILRPIAIANLAFSTINTILTFTFSSKLSGKYSVGAMIFLTINKGGSGKNTGIKEGHSISHKSQTVQPLSLISNEQSLTRVNLQPN